MDADWPAVLTAELDRAATDPDEAAFGRTLQRMMVPLADGHARIAGPGSPSVQSTPPLAWDWVEGRLVVTAADTAGLAPGDVVLTVDGVPAADTLASLEAHLSGTPQWKRYRALEWLRAGASDSALTLGIRDGGGAERSVALRRSRPRADAPAPERPATGAEIAPGVRYVDLTTLTDAEWAEALPALVAADGVVLDLRGYPTGTAVAVLQHLTDTPIRSARWTVAEVTRPDRENLRWEETRWDLEPLAPHLDAEVAFLTDGRAISYAETVLGIVEAYGLGAIVGAPTAGANGNITRLALPSGHTLTWTGMRVIKHDGSQHHLVGIPPTLPAAPTVAAVRAGRDEVLERGIAAVTD